jgi:hypothetical protein
MISVPVPSKATPLHSDFRLSTQRNLLSLIIYWNISKIVTQKKINPKIHVTWWRVILNLQGWNFIFTMTLIPRSAQPLYKCAWKENHRCYLGTGSFRRVWEIYKTCAEFLVLIAVTMKRTISWEVMLRSLTELHLRFWGKYYLHLHNRRVRQGSKRQAVSRFLEVAAHTLLVFLIGLLLCPEHWSRTFLRNVSKLHSGYTVLHPRRKDYS